ncbi:unnamed protein product, partial [marine sediment metagenome]
MSNFIRDLAIAKFPRFGIVYYIQVANTEDPEIHGSNVRVPLKFWDGKATPPVYLVDKVVKMPIWKWGDFMDVLEAEMYAEHHTICAVELVKRRDGDEYGHLEVQLDKQATLDSNLLDAPTTSPSGPLKPAAASEKDWSSCVSSERGQPEPAAAPPPAVAGEPCL